MSKAAVLIVGVLCALVAAPACAQVGARESPVEMSVSRAQVATRLGDDFGFSTTIRNAGTEPLSGLVAHLNVVGLSRGIYVDPEDWSSERTKKIPSLGPGESRDVLWSLTAVTGGHAAVYVVVLPDDPARGGLAVSPAVDVHIADTKDLNSGGVLPLALGVPALIGLAMVAVRRRRGR